MHIKSLKQLFAILILTVGALFSHSGFANILTIDNFTDFQAVKDRGNTVGATIDTLPVLTGTGLTNVSRIFTAEATTAGGSSSHIGIKSEGNLLKISNSSASSGSASIVWNFDPKDFTPFGNAMLLEVVDTDLNVSAEMVVNGIASSGIKTFVAVDDFLVNFNDFSNSGMFGNVNSFRLNFTGPVAWSGQFRLLITTTPVPLPSAYFLMGSVLIGFMGISRRKSGSW
jgi:hypothetical protein